VSSNQYVAQSFPCPALSGRRAATGEAGRPDFYDIREGNKEVAAARENPKASDLTSSCGYQVAVVDPGPVGQGDVNLLTFKRSQIPH
jgi:hypothetical protein